MEWSLVVRDSGDVPSAAWTADIHGLLIRAEAREPRENRGMELIGAACAATRDAAATRFGADGQKSCSRTSMLIFAQF